MPPLKPPDQTLFSPAQLQSLIDRESDDRLQLRLRAVLALMEGESQQSVAAKLGCSTASVREWVKRWNQGGYCALLDDRRGSLVTQVAREECRRNGYDLVREGSYMKMMPLATNTSRDENGEPLKPLWFANWDRPSKGSLRNLFE